MYPSLSLFDYGFRSGLLARVELPSFLHKRVEISFWTGAIFDRISLALGSFNRHDQATCSLDVLVSLGVVTRVNGIA